MSMVPIDEGNEKDMESAGGDPGPARSPSPSPGMDTPAPAVTQGRIITGPSRTLAPPKKLGYSNSGNSLGGSFARRSLSSLGDWDACSDTSSCSGSDGKALAVSSSGKHLTGSSQSLRGSCSSRSVGFPAPNNQKKMYVKQVTGKHNDTRLHLAAMRGGVESVRQILEEVEAQVKGNAEIQTAIVNEINELGETPLFVAAEKGHLEVVIALLPHTTREGIVAKNRAGLDALHVAVTQAHADIVQALLDYDRGLCRTFGQSNATPLISAATRGHTAIVHILLENDSSLIHLSKKNGKNALHFSVRQGHVEITEALLSKDPQLARKTDKKGQTALHMAVKGNSSEVVKLLLCVDPSTAMIPDRFGNVALHIATRKKRVQTVKELLSLPETDVNALTRTNKTALDIAHDLPFSEEASEMKETLVQCGGLRANELNQPKDELRQTMSEIQKKVHNQLEQARRTDKNVHGIAKDLKKLHREGINNATNSVTVVAVLFATVAFATLFTVPGGNYPDGLAVMVRHMSFKVFFISNALSLFTSLSVVVVQMTLVRGETKTETRVVGVINKMMWLAAICTTLAFMSSSYIIVGKHHVWAAAFVTVLGGAVMAGVLGAMTLCVLKHKKINKVRKKDKSSNHEPENGELDELELEANAIYAI